jgi:hypothetical protein
MCEAAFQTKKHKSAMPAVDLRKPMAVAKKSAASSPDGGFRLAMRRDREESNQLLISSDRSNYHHCTPLRLPAASSGDWSCASSRPSTPRTPTPEEDEGELAPFATSPPRLAPTPELYRSVVAFPESLLIPDF